MDLSAYKAISINGIPMKKITIGGVVAWVRPMINWVRRAIDTDGSIYNGGLGYKQGYRVRSGGAEAATSYVSCTGYIKVDPGDVVRLGNCEFSRVSNANAINVSDANFTNIGQFTMQPAHYGIFEGDYLAYSASSVVEESTGVWKWIVPPAASGVAYIRVTFHGTNLPAGPTDMIVTINEEIK